MHILLIVLAGMAVEIVIAIWIGGRIAWATCSTAAAADRPQQKE
jgi:hypothetical protein